MPINGVAIVCLFGACNASPAANLAVPLTPVGQGGTVTAVGAVTGLPLVSLIQQSTNSAGPGVGERTIEAPLSVRGEFIRQNGPSRLAVVSV